MDPSTVLLMLFIPLVVYLIWLGIALRATRALEEQARLKELELLGQFLEKHGGIGDGDVARCLRETPLARNFGGADILESLYYRELNKIKRNALPQANHASPPDDLRPRPGVFEKMRSDELREIVDNPVHYTPEAVDLAHKILASREEK